MSDHVLVTREQGEAILSELVTAEQWEVCSGVIRTALQEGLGFAMGGGLAFSAYSGNKRNTKDMDFFVLPRHQERLREIMAEHGFQEYTAVPYDPTWSYRGHRQDYIIDLLWRMLNNRSPVNEEWVNRGWEVSIRGVKLKLLAPEELLWSKLYILRRDRCDWPDILGLLFAQAPAMDWDHLLRQLGPDAPVLGAVVALFRWLCPSRVEGVTASTWERMGMCKISLAGSPRVDRQRLAYFMGEEWFPEVEE